MPTSGDVIAVLLARHRRRGAVAAAGMLVGRRFSAAGPAALAAMSLTGAGPAAPSSTRQSWTWTRSELRNHESKRKTLHLRQCWGSPGSGMGKKSRSGSRIRIRDEQPRSFFRELRKHFLGLKYLNSLMRIRDPGIRNPGKNSEPGIQDPG